MDANAPQIQFYFSAKIFIKSRNNDKSVSQFYFIMCSRFVCVSVFVCVQCKLRMPDAIVCMQYAYSMSIWAERVDMSLKS